MAMRMMPIIEISRQGLITAMGVSAGLTAGAITSKGSLAQKKKYGPTPSMIGYIWASSPTTGSHISE